MDFADDAEDLAKDGSDVAAGAEDLAWDGPDGADRVQDAPAAGYADDAAGEPGDVSGLAGDVRADEAEAAARPSTGEPRVDAALARLDELQGRPVTEHRAVFEDVHRRLRDVLGELDSRQQPPSGDAADATDAAVRPGR
jgi:hypothetical protein